MSLYASLMAFTGVLICWLIGAVLLSCIYASRRPSGEPRLSVVNWITYAVAFTFYLVFVNFVFLISCASGIVHASMCALRELNDIRRESIEDYSVTLRDMLNGLFTGGK